MQGQSSSNNSSAPEAASSTTVLPSPASSSTAGSPKPTTKPAGPTQVTSPAQVDTKLLPLRLACILLSSNRRTYEVCAQVKLSGTMLKVKSDWAVLNSVASLLALAIGAVLDKDQLKPVHAAVLWACLNHSTCNKPTEHG